MCTLNKKYILYCVFRLLFTNKIQSFPEAFIILSAWYNFLLQADIKEGGSP